MERELVQEPLLTKRNTDILKRYECHRDMLSTYPKVFGYFVRQMDATSEGGAHQQFQLM
jgi:hypothetical protein